MKLLLLNVFVLGIVGFSPFTVKAEKIFGDNFDQNSTPQLNLFNSTSFCSNKPFSGNSHLQIVTQSNTLKVFSSLQTLILNKGKNYLISFYVDARGVGAKFTFSCGGINTTLVADSLVMGYQLVSASFSVDQHVFGKIDLEIQSFGSKKILLDDFSIVECTSVVPERPLPTQSMANGHGYAYDVFEKIELDGVSLESNNRTTVDGYRIWTDLNTELMPGIPYELDVNTSSSNFSYELVAWIDLNGNGFFDTNESLNVTRTSAEKAKIQLILPSDFNANTCSVRLRYLQENENQLVTPNSGNHWGETVDLLLNVTIQSQEPNCWCTDPYYMDLNGKIVNSLNDAPSGMYIYVCGDCTKKIVSIRE